MSYQVLARQYRPRDFHTMAGQSHVLQALINALDSGRLHHAYLFTGTRGVGKTTIARIFAKCLNCEQKISSKPCGVCASCKAIDAGRFVDLIEVDAASRTKVDDTRELLDNVQYAPTNGRFKVYLIDEVHMLSTASFNALLKTLEEPPPRVKFLLATTDPQKLPVTVLSRCLQFNLKALSLEQISNYLEHILNLEQISFEPAALQLLAKAGAGSMRDALSLSDQAIAFGGGKLLTKDVISMLGSIDNTYVLALLQALINGDAKDMLAKVTELEAQGADFMAVLNELLALLHQIALAQLIATNDAAIMQLAKTVNVKDIQFYYQMGLIGKRDLPLAHNAKAGFEMLLLRMLAFRPINAKYEPSNKLNSAVIQAKEEEEEEEEEQKPPVNLSDDKTDEAITEQTDNLNNVSALNQTTNLPLNENSAIKQDEDNLINQEQQNSAQIIKTQETKPLITEQQTPELLAAKWQKIMPKLDLSGRTKILASNCNLVKTTADVWHLQLEPNFASSFNGEQQSKIAAAISNYLQQDIKLEVIIAPNQQLTPAQVIANQQQKDAQLLNEQIGADPIVQQLQQQFSATITKVEPIL